jgi:N-acetylmuramoyl-L-alanine amidase
MKRFGFTAKKFAPAIVAFALGVSMALALLAAPPAQADPKSESQKQFERAVKLRTMLEGYLEKDRSLSDYQQTVLAFRKVYLITPEAPDATQALTAEAELYETMGRLFDAKFFGDAVGRFNFLLKQYPGTRYHGESLFAIGRIEKDDLRKPGDATATFKEFLKRYPRSDRAADAQQALKDIANPKEAAQTSVAQQQAEQAQVAPVQPGKSEHSESKPRKDELRQIEGVSNSQPDLRGQAVEPRVSDERISSVTEVQTWNSPDSTRIIVTLNDTIKYDAARIASPDRIYFNLYKAKVGLKLTRKALDVGDGNLQSVRVAQNKPDVVRLVLNINGDKDYSAFLLANPYRLVIDLHPRAATGTAKASPPVATPSPVGVPATATAASSREPEPTLSKAAAVPAEKPAAKPSVSAEAGANSNAISTPEPPAKTLAQPATSSAKVAEKTVLPLSKDAGKTTSLLQPPAIPKPTRDGQRSLTRALGLKISRIVIDAGHGGHDTGTIGPHGLMEKDLCLDVALRLGGLIEEKLPGAEVVYTRKDDTFVPLEERTNIANQAQADLFISIHANSSHDNSARGVETYYLNFATTEEAMEVASRENAFSQESLHDLQDLIKKIARNDKVEESKELASDIQDSLTQRLQLVSRGERNRGVKKAPFVVLIGANMPSILSEISFVSNPNDEKLLRKGDQRQRIADGLYRGISSYLDSLNSLSNNKQKLVSDNPADATLASNGNAK